MKPPPPPSPDAKGFYAVLGLLLVIGAPTLATLAVIQNPAPLLPPPEQFASPYGYTVSLLLFLLPIGVIALWFLRHPSYHLERRAFWLTVGILAPMGFGLDILLGNSFFTFLNPGATLGLHGPGFSFTNGWEWNIPLEEFVFYFTGFLAILLFYIWNDLYWLPAYGVNDRLVHAQQLTTLIAPHWVSLWVGVALAVAGIIYKKFFPHPYQAGFPGYFVFLTLAGLGPTFALFRTARLFINWRAFSLTLFVLLLVSLLWEGTLGVPYQWWGYQYDQMLGLTIKPWGNLPVEAVIVWLVVTWATIIFYEVVRVYLHLHPAADMAATPAPSAQP